MNAHLDFCLTLHHAHASLQRKLDDELGTFHGIGFGDFVLLDVLARTEAGRMDVPDLVRPLGQPVSALVRQLIVLEKIGLVAREGGNGSRQAVLRPAGRALVQSARDTAARICDAAFGSIATADAPEVRAAMRALACAPVLAMS